MSSIHRLVALSAVASLVFASAAVAKVAKVTGGSTQITITSAVSTALTANHLTVSPLAPATASGSVFTFPIVRGRVNGKNFHGLIEHRGGLSISNGTRTVSFRRPTIVSTKRGVSMYALAITPAVRRCVRTGHAHHRHCRMVIRHSVVRIARITEASVTNGVATGTVRLTAFSARVINALAAKSIAKAGTPLGTVTVTPTVG